MVMGDGNPEAVMLDEADYPHYNQLILLKSPPVSSDVNYQKNRSN